MGERPATAKPPVYLRPPPPGPEPQATQRPEHDPLGTDPVRYGDWELKGIAVDF